MDKIRGKTTTGNRTSIKYDDWFTLKNVAPFFYLFEFIVRIS